MTQVADIIRFVERSTGHHINREEGVWHGSADARGEPCRPLLAGHT